MGAREREREREAEREIRATHTNREGERDSVGDGGKTVDSRPLGTSFEVRTNAGIAENMPIIAYI
jgi:hypothetical protein